MHLGALDFSVGLGFVAAIGKEPRRAARYSQGR